MKPKVGCDSNESLNDDVCDACVPNHTALTLGDVGLATLIT
jgi:hypothetical protein